MNIQGTLGGYSFRIGPTPVSSAPQTPPAARRPWYTPAVVVAVALALFLGGAFAHNAVVGTSEATPPGPAPNQVAGGQVENGMALAVAFSACQAGNQFQAPIVTGATIGTSGIKLLSFRDGYHQQLSNWLCHRAYYTSLAEACVPVELTNNVTGEVRVFDCSELAENAAWADTGVTYWRDVVNSGLVGPDPGVICGVSAGRSAWACFFTSAPKTFPAGVTQAGIDAAIAAALAAEG